MVVESEGGSVDSDDISYSLDNGEIFELCCIQNKGCIVAGVTSSLGVFQVEGCIDDFQGADVLFFVGLVWESCVYHNRVKVLKVS